MGKCTRTCDNFKDETDYSNPKCYTDNNCLSTQFKFEHKKKCYCIFWFNEIVECPEGTTMNAGQKTCYTASDSASWLGSITISVMIILAMIA